MRPTSIYEQQYDDGTRSEPDLALIDDEAHSKTLDEILNRPANNEETISTVNDDNSLWDSYTIIDSNTQPTEGSTGVTMVEEYPDVAYSEYHEELRANNDEGRFYDDDIMSLPSDQQDIGSQTSMHRPPYIIIAEDRLSRTLAQNEELKPLCRLALSKMSQEAFVDNFRRLLKSFHQGLASETTSPLENTSVSFLRKRVTRTRIAYSIANLLRPDSEHGLFSPEDRDRQLFDKDKLLEEWFRRNAALASDPDSGLDPTSFREENEDKEEEEEEEDEEGRDIELNLPNIELIEKFLLGTDAFRKLLVSMRVFMLPASLSSLTRIILTIPSERITFTEDYDQSLLDRLKTRVEVISGEAWNWWPCAPGKPKLAEGDIRINWQCVGLPRLTFNRLHTTNYPQHCGTFLSEDVTKTQADEYKELLRLRGPKGYNDDHLCYELGSAECFTFLSNDNASFTATVLNDHVTYPTLYLWEMLVKTGYRKQMQLLGCIGIIFICLFRYFSMRPSRTPAQQRDNDLVGSSTSKDTTEARPSRLSKSVTDGAGKSSTHGHSVGSSSTDQFSQATGAASQHQSNKGTPISLPPKAWVGQSGRSSQNAVSNQQTSQGITIPSNPMAWVLLGVSGSRQIFEIAHLDTKATRMPRDGDFFRTLRKEYTKIRGSFRQYLSVWQLNHCDFVKVSAG